MQDAPPVANYQSSLAVYLHNLAPSLKKTLQFNEPTILVIEAVVSICKALTNDSDSRSWQDRMEDCFSNIDEAQLEELLIAFADEFEGDKPKRWVKKLKNEGYRSFAKRLLGAAQYRIFVQAAQADAAIAALAIRRGVRALTPFAIAWSDAVTLMSQSQIKAVNKAEIFTVNAVQLVVTFDDFLGEKLLASLPMDTTSATTTDLSALAPDGPEELAGKLRTLVAESSARRVERANSPLVKKIRGARDALKYSEDGVSQAANSLIELIDRIMREAFPPKEVLFWVDKYLPEEPELVHFVDNQRRPTKRAEALCFVYGGGLVTSDNVDQSEGPVRPSFIHNVLATVLVSARSKLQKLKHADSGTPEEREQLMAVLTALEGALMLGLAVGRFPAESADTAEVSAVNQ